MVRIAKQAERRNMSKWRPSVPGKKTGAKKDKLAAGFREHPNALSGDLAANRFIPKVN